MSSIGAADIAEAFRRCGIGPGDTLMLHGDAMVLAQLPPMSHAERFEMFFSALEGLLGPEGTLMLPTFSYSFTRGEPFDVAATPSTVGSLTEYFRQRPGVRRSSDPIFSVAASGRLADAFAAVPVGDCFGPQSAFALLEAHDAHLACLGCSFDRITFTHYAEQKSRVDYRYFKEFSGTLTDTAGTRPAAVRYFVRDLDRRTAIDLSRLRLRLAASECLKTGSLGRVGLLAVRSRDFLKAASELLAESPSALIEEGQLA